MKRIALFLVTNIAILAVITVIVRLFGLDQFLTANGLNLPLLLGFSAVVGMGGSFVSLLMSKWLAKRSTGAEVIKEPRNAAEMWLFNTVERQARAAGIGMPEVAIYDSPEPNAFATGANKNNALVAVSTGLLQNMKQEEVEAVLGHEIGHVANGDMVTLALVQGVVNTFVVFLSRVIAYAATAFLSRGENRGEAAGGPVYFVVSLVMQILLGVLASIVVAWFSRRREFRADEAGAHFAGKRKMIAALERLRSLHEVPPLLPKEIKTFGIRGTVASLFATHPPLERRIAALQAQP